MNIPILNRKNRLVSMFVDQLSMTIVIGVLEAPMILSNAFNMPTIGSTFTSNIHWSIYDILVFSLYFNKDIFLGKSMAKQILRLQVVNNRTGLPAGPLRCLFRNLTLLFWPIEVVAALINVKRRIGDYIAGTRLDIEHQAISAPLKWKEIILCIPIAAAFEYLFWIYPSELLLRSLAAYHG